MNTFVKTITFGRHGQSEQNVIKPNKLPFSKKQIERFKKRDSGDHRLTMRGVTEGEAMGELLRSIDYQPTLLVTSTFARAQETLLATSYKGKVEITPLLDERHTGEHEHMLHNESNKRFPETMTERKRNETRWRPPNGESMREVLTRTLLFMEHLKHLPGGNEHVFVVAHSRVIASYIWWAEQLEYLEVPPSAGYDKSGRSLANGQIVQYGWTSAESLRPSHKRIFVPRKGGLPEWKQLPKDARFSTADLRRMVEQHQPILS